MVIKNLIITADDYGISPEVNEGIKKCVESRAISGVSVMANGILTDLKALIFPHIAFGAHLNITHGSPMNRSYPVNYLENGRFPKYFRRDNVQQYAIEDEVIEEEFKCQIEHVGRFVDISYLDCHHHLHELPQIMSVVEKLAQDYNLAVRAVNNKMSEYLSGKGIKCAKGCILDFFEGGATKEHLLELLEQETGDIKELVTHPGYVSAHIDDDYNHGRLNEMTVLTDPDMMTWIKSRFRMINYRDKAYYL